MRIVAGRWRGRRLEAPPGHVTRPITDRIKETIFNIVGARLGRPGTIPDVAVLDLFAGSGSLGLEAVSRGAASCLFVERDRRALKTLRANLAKLQLGQRCRVAAENAWTSRIPQAAEGYGLVFIDPPYKDAAEPMAMLNLLERLTPLLAPGALVVFRQSAAHDFPAHDAPGLVCVDARVLGSMRFWLFLRGQSEGTIAVMSE